jgi:hypothetical protein
VQQVQSAHPHAASAHPDGRWHMMTVLEGIGCLMSIGIVMVIGIVLVSL